MTQERIDELNRVKGWIEPVFVHEDPMTGRQHRLITQADGEMIAAGYACGECGAKYDMVMPSCTVCYKPIGLELAPMREEWAQHLSDRDEGYAPSIAKNPFSPDTFIEGVKRDKDIEQVKL